MKKLICGVMALLLVGSVFAGCQKKVSGKVTTDGSTSMEEVIGALGESFMNNNKGSVFPHGDPAEYNTRKLHCG